MKTLKILFYISFGICAIQLLAYLFMPFGGPLGIYHLIKDGGAEITLKEGHVISLDRPPYSEYPTAKYLNIFSVGIRIVYFGSLIACSLLPLFYKMDLRRKYILGISLVVLSTVVTGLTGAIWRHLVKVYLGV